MKACLVPYLENTWGSSHPGWPQKGLIGNSRFNRKTQKQLQKLFNNKEVPKHSKSFKKVSPNSQDDTIIDQNKIDMWKAKAAAFDGEKRRDQAEIKSSLNHN